MNLGFYMPTKVIVGKDCVRENSDVFKIGKKALIVTGKNSAKLSGALDDVKYALEKNNIEYVIFDKVMSNPGKGLLWFLLPWRRNKRIEEIRIKASYTTK